MLLFLYLGPDCALQFPMASCNGHGEFAMCVEMKAGGECQVPGKAGKDRKAMRYRPLRTGAPLLLLGVLAFPSAAVAGELWMVSTRALCSAQGSTLDTLDVWKLGPDGCWVRTRADEFLSTAGPAVPITLFLHGNRADFARSIEMGWQVYNRLSCEAGDRPFRLLIWSWPSDRIQGVRRDAEAKICRSDDEAQLLAMFLNRLRSDARLNLFGYSLGARIATGALELLAGGQVAGHVLADRRDAPRTPVRAMLVAAAEDADSFTPGQCHGLAFDKLERALVAYNPCDRALRFYPRVSGGASALGYVGPCCSLTTGACAKLDTANVCCSVGRDHNWENYFSASDVRSRLAWYAFLADSPAAPSVAVNP